MTSVIDLSDTEVQEKIVITLIGVVLLVIGSIDSISGPPGGVYQNLGAFILTVGALLLIKQVYTEIQ